MTVNQISLTTSAGKTVSLTNTPVMLQFMPWNGSSSPLLTVSVPQGTYTSATVSVSNAGFTYLHMDPLQGLYTSTDAYSGSTANAVVQLAHPLAITGNAMGLDLDLDVSASATLNGYNPNPSTYTIQPTFRVSTFAVPLQANSSIGRCYGIPGQISSVDAAGQTITFIQAGLPTTSSPTFTVGVNASTQFEGITSASSLAVGNFVALDLALQADGSYAATRIEVLQDPGATNVGTGLVMQVDPSASRISFGSLQQQGTDLSALPTGFGSAYVYDSSTRFQISAQAPYLTSLPFPAVFTSNTLAAGQNVVVGSGQISYSGGIFTKATSLTLTPQLIDAQIASVASSGSYTVYTVFLADYDTIVQLNSPGSGVVDRILPAANAVSVYVNSSTAINTTTPLTAGSTARFHGLLFNDAGTLRLVADRILDGVPQ